MEIAATLNPVTYVMEALRSLILEDLDWSTILPGFARRRRPRRADARPQRADDPQLRLTKRYAVWACGSLANARTFAGSIRNTAAPPSLARGERRRRRRSARRSPYFASRRRRAAAAPRGPLTRTAVPSTTTSRPSRPRVVAGGQRDLRVVLEVARLLLLEAGAEVHRLVVKDADQRRHVRPAVGAHGREPVQLGLLERARDLGPGRRAGLGVAEAAVELGGWLGLHRRGCLLR